MTHTNATSIDVLGSVAAGHGNHHHFLNHLATVKVEAGNSDSGLALVEFLAPRGFGPPLHRHDEEDELMYILTGEIRIDLGNDESTVATAGTAISLPRGIPHIWQVLSDESRFLCINAGRRDRPSFDRFVTALGVPIDPHNLPAPVPIDPGRVARVCAEHGIEVLGPPPPPLD